MIRDLLLIGLGGGAGSICRYLLGTALATGGTGGFPTGTFCVNVVGSLLIGIALALPVGGQLRLLAVVGFCGGFTTFSTFSAETVALLQKGACGTAALYAAASLAACLLATAAGWQIGSRVMNG